MVASLKADAVMADLIADCGAGSPPSSWPGCFTHRHSPLSIDPMFLLI
jgi:hypothetical protein